MEYLDVEGNCMLEDKNVLEELTISLEVIIKYRTYTMEAIKVAKVKKQEARLPE